MDWCVVGIVSTVLLGCGALAGLGRLTWWVVGAANWVRKHYYTGQVYKSWGAPLAAKTYDEWARTKVCALEYDIEVLRRRLDAIEKRLPEPKAGAKGR